MKVHIISKNSSDAELAEQALSFEAVIESTDSELSATEEDVVIFDYAIGKKAILMAIKSHPGPVYVVFYDEIKTKDQKELENAESPPHALLKRPVTEEFLMDILGDFLTLSNQSGTDKTTTNPELGDLTFIGQKNVKKENKLAEAIEAFDTDEDEEENESAENLQEFKMSSGIKDIIKKHSLSAERTPNFESKENQNIQRKFDLVFPEASIPSEKEDGAKFKPIDEDLLRGISEDIKPIDALSLDLDGEVEDLTSPKNKVAAESEDQVAIFDTDTITMSEETEKVTNTAQSKKPEEIMSEEKRDPKEDASLMFDLGVDLDKELVGDAKPSGKNTPAAVSSDPGGEDVLDLGGLDLNPTESDGAAAMISGAKTENLPAADGLELGEEEGHTTVFKGKSVELGSMELPTENDGDLVFDSASAKTEETLTEDNTDEGGGLELEVLSGEDDSKPAPKSDSTAKKAKPEAASDDLDLDLDLDINDEGPTKVSAKDSDEPIQEFDYKSSVRKAAPKTKTEDEINLDEEIDLDMSSEVAVGPASDDISLDDDIEDEEEDDVPTRILTDNKRKAAEKKKKVEVIDVSEGDDEGPMIIGTEKIPSATLNENDLVRLQSTIRHLKGERESLLKEVESLKDQKREVAQENVGLRAEIDDLRIEISIMRKRSEKDLDHSKEQLKAHEDRKSMYEEKLKQYQKEIERLNHKLRVDFTKVKQREKELESQLELQAMDSENQIKSRDKKILELKRKIDSLEFNMENASIREQKFREDKDKIEERMNKIIHTLRNSINVLEDDLDLDEETLEKLRKL